MRTAIHESESAEESVISVKNESREKKGLYFWRYSVDCCAHVIGSCCARGKTYCTFNTRDISWDSGDIFCALKVGFCELASQKQKNQHWEERAQLFVGIMGAARVSHLIVTRIVAGKSKFITIRKLSLTIKTTFSD